MIPRVPRRTSRHVRRTSRPLALAVGALLLATPAVACSASPAPHTSSGAAGSRSVTVSTQARPATSATGARSAGAGTSAQPAAGTVAATDWPTYHGDAARTGVAAASPAVTRTPTKVWDLTLDGAVYASPIVVDNGVRIVVTENDTVYRIAKNKVVWKYHIGTPVPRSALPCGDIDPLGITGTPAYDAATNTVVVVAELGSPVHHTAVGIDPLTGHKRWARIVDVPSSVPGISPAAMQQRGALIVSHGRVYVPYGGLAGDCSSYRGSVVGVTLADPNAPLWHYTIPTSREAGIWAPPGPSVSPQGGLLVAAGNGATAGSGTYDSSDSVLRLASQHIVDSFSPSTWRDDNANDLDLGSQGPTIVGTKIFIAGKRGTAYVLDGAKLGGVGGQLSSMDLCKSFGGTAVYHSVVYVPCTDGLRAVQIHRDGTMTVLWHAASSITGSPVIGGGRVWSLDTGGGLHMLNPTTGQDYGTLATHPVNRFATPALSGANVYVGTLTGVVAYSWS